MRIKGRRNGEERGLDVRIFLESVSENRGCRVLDEEGRSAKIYVDINKYRSSKEKDK